MKVNSFRTNETVPVLSKKNTHTIKRILLKTFKRINSKRTKETDNINETNIELKRPTISIYKNKSIPSTVSNKTSKIINYREKKDNIKSHLNEIIINNLLEEKYRDSKRAKIEDKEKYSNKIIYQKLIMRAKLLKALKTNIVLKKNIYNRYVKKYPSDNQTLSQKIFNPNNHNQNIKTSRFPKLFSNYAYSPLFRDLYCTPDELINRLFTDEQKRIINLDPVFFKMDKEPFDGISKDFIFNLKDKINEEDLINDLRHHKVTKNKSINLTKKIRPISMHNQEEEESEKISTIRTNQSNKTKIKIPKKKNSLDLTFNKNFFANKYSYGQSYKNLKRCDFSLSEKIKDKKKRMTMEEYLELFSDRKRVYLDDLSFNRRQIYLEFMKLRSKHYENIESEQKEKENIRKIIEQIEDNYRNNQK
jgi:hypothetical protein